MQELFKAAIERGASDIHIKTGDFIRARIHGELQPLTQKRLSVEQVTGIALKLIPTKRIDRTLIRSWTTTVLGAFQAWPVSCEHHEATRRTLI